MLLTKQYINIIRELFYGISRLLGYFILNLYFTRLLDISFVNE